VRDTVIIAGDSWGAGEWTMPESPGPMIRLHPGLQYYLEEQGQRVINISKRGGSNLDSLKQCDQFLTHNSDWAKTVRSVVFFQTEWVRDIMDLWHIAEAKKCSISECKLQWVSRFYINLSKISRKFDIPVYVIGGASDTDWFDTFNRDHPGVEIPCQSMTNLLVNDDPKVETPIMLCSGLAEQDFLDLIINLHGQQLTLADKQFVLDEIEKSEARCKTWNQNPQWFYPDGSHANRKGHKKLFEYLCDTVQRFLI